MSLSYDRLLCSQPADFSDQNRQVRSPKKGGGGPGSPGPSQRGGGTWRRPGEHRAQPAGRRHAGRGRAAEEPSTEAGAGARSEAAPFTFALVHRWRDGPRAQQPRAVSCWTSGTSPWQVPTQLLAGVYQPRGCFAEASGGNSTEHRMPGQKGTRDLGTGLRRLTGKSPGRVTHMHSRDRNLCVQRLRARQCGQGMSSPRGPSRQTRGTQKSKGVTNKCSEPVRRMCSGWRGQKPRAHPGSAHRSQTAAVTADSPPLSLCVLSCEPEPGRPPRGQGRPYFHLRREENVPVGRLGPGDHS